MFLIKQKIILENNFYLNYFISIMKDMLVKLYDLPKKCKELEELSKTIAFRRPLAAEKSIVNKWVNKENIFPFSSHCNTAVVTGEL